ncbi:MAG: hypothetical protein PHE96_02890 [Methylococcales bacterium]|nr:hypothetical protein [Methylococcales bacterium]
MTIQQRWNCWWFEEVALVIKTTPSIIFFQINTVRDVTHLLRNPYGPPNRQTGNNLPVDNDFMARRHRSS